MAPTYRIELTPQHYATAILRFERQRADYWRNKLMPLAPLALSLLAAAVAAFTQSEWEGFLILLSIGGAAAAFLWWFMRRRFIERIVRRSPEFGESIVIELQERGARSIARGNATLVEWGAFTHATAFPDGFVLSQGTVNSWLPHADLNNATPAEVASLLRAHLPRVQVIHPA